jgi:hypothetical protein
MEIQGDSVCGAGFENDAGQMESALRDAEDDWMQMDTELQATKKRDKHLAETSRMYYEGKKVGLRTGASKNGHRCTEGYKKDKQRSGKTGSSWAPHRGETKRHRWKSRV